MGESIVIETCHSCPFSRWSDHACGHGKNGTLCSISDIVIPFTTDTSSPTYAKNYIHKDCPIRKESYVKTYTVRI
jgi:hypothetical protein